MRTDLYNINYKKVFIGSSLTGLIGLIAYEAYKFRRRISSLVQPNVLELEKKGPEFIYINYHIYRATMEKLKAKEQRRNNIMNVIGRPFNKWLKTVEHSIAWRLLQIAQTGDQHERGKAVRQLVLIDHLKEWDYQHLAQLCDSRTAISLARSGCDKRWFLKPKHHGVLKNPKILLKDIHQLLEDMKPNKCIDYFFNKVFSSSQIKDPDADDLFVSQGDPLPPQESDLLRQCVEELLHLSFTMKVAQQMIENGALAVLAEILKHFRDDPKVVSEICEIISNLSLCHDKVEDFFVTGWIRMLSEWANDCNIKIKLMSAKALANLDRDDTNNFVYMHKVFPLYPRKRTKQKPEADVVFIHGLLGSVFITWRQKDKFEVLTMDGSGKNAARDGNGNGKSPKKFTQKLKDTKRMEKLEQINQMSDPESKVIKLKNLEHSPNQEPLGQLSNKLIDSYKEIIQSLESGGELRDDWEVVFPDCPVNATAKEDGPYSVSGVDWFNDDCQDDYTNCWPMDWLPDDFPSLRIIGCNYESSLSHWSRTVGCSCETKTGRLVTRSREFLEYLAESNVGQTRPVIFVGHSMGGLIAKSIIVQSLESDDPRIRAIGENTKAVLFMGTPHKGSPVAKLKQHTQLLLSPTIEVVEMYENAHHLLQLNDKFLDIVNSRPNQIDVVSFVEALPTIFSTTFKLPFRIVSESSALIDAGDTYIFNDDHLGICKPVFRQSFLYQRILKMIEKSLPSFEKKTDKQ